MGAATRDRVGQKRGPSLQRGYPVAAATIIYAHTLVAINTAGYAVPAADAAAFKVVGVAMAQVDNVAGAAGDKTVVVESGVEMLFPATSITQAMVGRPMFVVDDQTFDDTPGSHAIFAGFLTEYVSSSSGWLFIPHAPIGENIAGLKAGRVTWGQHTTVAAADTVVTGLAVVVGAIAVLNDDPVDGAMYVTANVGDQAGAPAAGSILINTWKNTDADATHVVATTFSESSTASKAVASG